MIKIALIFALIIAIKGDNEECESVSSPKTRYDCFRKSNETGLCCFQIKKSNDTNTTTKADNDTSAGECVWKDLQNLKNSDEIDCGVNKEKNYQTYEFTPYRPNQVENPLGFKPCGRVPEKGKGFKKSKCTDYSQLMNSCCLFKFGGEDERGCYFIGKTYSGSSKKVSFTEDGKNYTYECSSFYLKSVLSLILLLFLQ